MVLQPTGLVDVTVSKPMYYSPNVLLILFYLLIGDNGEPYLKQFKKICLLSIMSIFLIMTFNYLGFISNTYEMLIWFCGVVFVMFTIVLINGMRHGIFKRYENE